MRKPLPWGWDFGGVAGKRAVVVIVPPDRTSQRLDPSSVAAFSQDFSAIPRVVIKPVADGKSLSYFDWVLPGGIGAWQSNRQRNALGNLAARIGFSPVDTRYDHQLR
jgi:hypothetical protein